MRPSQRTTRPSAPGRRPGGREDFRSAEGARWWFAPPDCADAAGALDAAGAWIASSTEAGPFQLHDSTHEPLKRGDGRAVWRVQRGRATLFVKVYDGAAGAAERVRRWCGGCPAQREWQALRLAQARGVPTVIPVALGLSGGAGGRSALITAAFGEGSSLARTWSRADHDPIRRRNLAEAVATLIAAMCRAGIVHRDPHPHNILTQQRGDATRLALVDLYGATRSRPGRLSIATLVHLDQYMQRVASCAERLRCVRAVQSALAPEADPAVLRRRRRRVVADVAARKRRWGRKLARTRDRRVRGDGKYFARLDLGGGWCGTVVLIVARRHAVPAGATPDFTEADWRRRLGDLSGVAGAEARRLGGSADDSVERFRPGSAWRGMLWRWFGSPALRRFRFDHARRHRDIAAPLRLAALERRRRGRICEAILITARTDDATGRQTDVVGRCVVNRTKPTPDGEREAATVRCEPSAEEGRSVRTGDHGK